MRVTKWVMAAALGASAAPALAGTAVSPETLASFAVPHEKVVIEGGRALNLYCMGKGPRTVLFDAGGSDWSVIWGLVQPLVAAKARACSYDRAGLGYSDPAPGARSPIAIVDDLHALIAAAKIETPLVLVGHSLGGFNVKLYAALHPEQVAGLVLVDPAEERSTERAHARLKLTYGTTLTSRLELVNADGLRWLMGRYETCLAEAKKGALDPATIAYRRCSDPVRPALGPAVAAERQRRQVRPAYQEAQAGEVLNSVYARTDGDIAYAALFKKGMFGARPMIVLSHSQHDASDLLDAADYQSGLWLHRQTADLSRRGRQRVVPDTSHNIEIDAPGAIVDAVFEVLGQIDKR